MTLSVGLAGSLLLLSGCAGSYLARAPRSPSEPWTLPAEPPRAARKQLGPAVQAGHVYTLTELIDLAESANPDTRIGWELARQAALAVGIAKSEYFPTISALTIGGYQHVFFPIPTLSQSTIGVNPFEFLPSVSFPVPRLPPSGHVGVDTFQFLPFAAIRWLAFDLARGAEMRAAEERSVAANSLFTAEHQRVIFEVARAYFRLNAARAQVATAADALERTRSIAKAVEARYGQGIATSVALLESKREVAQAEYNLSQTQAIEIAARAALVTAMGVDPAARFEVAGNPSRELRSRLDKRVDSYVESALRTRPDLRAARARLPSSEAEIAKNTAAYVPRVSLVGTAGAAVLGARIDGGDLLTVTLPNVTAFVNIDWLLFDGGRREVQGEIARSQHSQAVQQLLKLEHQAVQEVVTAYNEVNAALSKYKAAAALLDTATVAEDAATKSYLNGLATFTDVMNAQKARALASSAKEQAFADALVAAAALAVASGELTSAKAVPNGE
jgi:outer membrane protein